MGDIVLTSALVRCLKEQGKHELHFLLKEAYLPVYEHSPQLSKILIYRESFRENLRQIKEQGYDLIIDLQKNIRSRRLLAFLRIRNLTFPKRNFKKWLLVNFKIDTLHKEHIVDRYFMAVKSLTIQNDGKGLDIYIPAKVRERVIIEYGLTRTPFVCFAIGGTQSTKRMPKEKIAELLLKMDLPIFLLGSEAEKATGEWLVDRCGGHVMNMCTWLTILESAVFLDTAKVIITHDTGMMHIAAALKKPVISIWGSTVSSFGMTPYYGDQKPAGFHSEVKDLSCRPCTKLGKDDCPKGHFKCMQEQDIAKIASEVLKL